MAKDTTDLLAWAYAGAQNSEAKSEKSISTKEALSTSYCQWSVLPNDTFAPSGPKITRLPAGVYKPYVTPNGPMFEIIKVVTDTLVELDDSASKRVLASMK